MAFVVTRGANSCTALHERYGLARTKRARLGLLDKALTKGCDWSASISPDLLAAVEALRASTKRDAVRPVAPTGLAGDIPMSAAIGAHRLSSFVPERRGEQEKASYEHELTQTYDRLARFANTPEKRAVLDEQFAEYRAGFRSRRLAHLHAKGKVPSFMITGPSNFPVARHAKLSRNEQSHWENFAEWQTRALAAMEKAVRPELAPVMAGDDDAVTRLVDKITQAEARQERMREFNKIVKRHVPKSTLPREVRILAAGSSGGPYGPAADAVRAVHEDQRARTAALDAPAAFAELAALGFSESEIRAKLKPNYLGDVGFESYELTNNSANIRRMNERLEQIRRDQARPMQSTEAPLQVPVTVVERDVERDEELGRAPPTAAPVAAGTVRLEDDPAANRVRLCFPGKPDATVRTGLKSNGFRWAPSTGCWQGYRNHRALEYARAFIAGGA